ncbi:MAG: hypothetical protein GX986_09570 [Firmicutes bacterium]|nr:hypothetical protein [Bacillota bacterium]
MQQEYDRYLISSAVLSGLLIRLLPKNPAVMRVEVTDEFGQTKPLR